MWLVGHYPWNDKITLPEALPDFPPFDFATLVTSFLMATFWSLVGALVYEEETFRFPFDFCSSSSFNVFSISFKDSFLTELD